MWQNNSSTYWHICLKTLRCCGSCDLVSSIFDFSAICSLFVNDDMCVGSEKYNKIVDMSQRKKKIKIYFFFLFDIVNQRR